MSTLLRRRLRQVYSDCALTISANLQQLTYGMSKKLRSPAKRVKLVKLQETGSTIRFSAKLVRPEATKKMGSWTVLTLPKNASAKLPSQGMTMIEGTINGFPFRAALEPDGKGGHRLKVNKAVLNAAGADADETVTMEITWVEEEPEVRVPLDLRKALAEAPLAQEMWADITPMARRDWILWISSGKLPETRTIRIEKACDMLASGKRRVCCFGGLNWLRQDHPTAKAEPGFRCRTQKLVFRRDQRSRKPRRFGKAEVRLPRVNSLF